MACVKSYYYVYVVEMDAVGHELGSCVHNLVTTLANFTPCKEPVVSTQNDLMSNPSLMCAYMCLLFRIYNKTSIKLTLSITLLYYISLVHEMYNC